MVRRADVSGSDWVMLDTARNTYNQVQNALFADLASAETTGYNFDFTANGFRPNNTGSPTQLNAGGAIYIYAAFAQNPLRNSLAF
jgi:hypothetical protein